MTIYFIFENWERVDFKCSHQKKRKGIMWGNEYINWLDLAIPQHIHISKYHLVYHKYMKFVSINLRNKQNQKY